MTAPRVSEAEFIAAWARHKGNARTLAIELGVGERRVFERRRSIEARAGLALNATTALGLAREKVIVPRVGYRVELSDVTGIVMIGSDGHFWPGERSVAFDAFVKLVKKLKPSVIILNGDSFDGSRISRHPPGGYAEQPTVADELAAVRERHAEIEVEAPTNCPLIWCAGNHDSRFTATLAQQAPDYVKVHGTDLADHFPAWQFTWSCFINSHTVVKHRFHAGVHGAYNNTLKSGMNIVTGHTHRLQVTQFSDYRGLRYGIESGMLSEMSTGNDKYSYAEDAPSNWSAGFAVLKFDDKGRLMEPALCRVIDGKAQFMWETL